MLIFAFTLTRDCWAAVVVEVVAVGGVVGQLLFACDSDYLLSDILV